MPNLDNLYIDRNYQFLFFDAIKSGNNQVKKYIENATVANSVNFSFQYSVLVSTMNVAKFRLYNLSKETIQLFTSTSSRRGIELFVGYGDYSQEDSAIFSGLILQSNTYYDGPDVITEVVAGDLFTNLYYPSFYKSYKKGTNLKVILNDLLTFYGNVASIDPGSTALLSLITYSMPVVIRGQFFTVVSRLASDANLFYTFQSNILSFVSAALPTGFTETVTGIPKISSNTGLVGYPRAIALSKQLYPILYNGNLNLNENLSLLQVTTLMKNYDLFSTIYLDSKLFTGYYKVLSVTYNGEWRGNPWYSNLTLWPVG